MVQLGLPAVVFVVLGSWASRFLNTLILQAALGVFLVALSLLFMIRRQLILKATVRNSILGGSLSGFSAGLLGTGGAIRGLTMSAFNLEKSVFIATSALIDLIIDLSRTVVYWSNGYIHKHDLMYLPFLVVVGLLGTWLGKNILAYLPQEKFRTISLELILIIGLVTLGSFVWPD